MSSAQEKKNHEAQLVEDLGIGPGTLPDEVYDMSMAWWRAGIRRALVRNLRSESRWLADMQKRVRTPWLDTYFVYTSTLGTHTFFMTVLPAFFFFGHHTVGRGLLHVLAAGVYVASLVKDSICSPRPYAPPVTRLTMGSHHLEYGFPSTHSTNSISIALYLSMIIYSVDLSPVVHVAVAILFGLYAFSIVFGRLYCGMHSFTDCVAGILMGCGIWAVQFCFGEVFENAMMTPGYYVPLTVIPVGLFLVNQHAEPVDDCPCFEDAIAFVSVIMGSTLAKWHSFNWGLDESSGFYKSRTPGSDGDGLSDWAVWSMFAFGKMVIGVLIIFVWRLVAKQFLHVVLPPTFRLLSNLFTLPTRRFYTAATEYGGPVPDEIGLHPIPSVIDLPSTLRGEGMNLNGGLLGNRYRELPGSEVKLRNGFTAGNGHANGNGYGLANWNGTGTGHSNGTGNGHANGDGNATKSEKDIVVASAVTKEVKVKHYDADVLTKVIVYCGIGWIATEFIPVMFEMLGWGVFNKSN